MISTDLEQQMLPGSSYGYSATPVAQLGATKQTLVVIAADDSGSIRPHAAEINRCIGATVAALRLDTQADNLLLRVTRFNQSVSEFHGFKPLMSCHEGDYVGVVVGQGGTALFDASENAVQSAVAYGATLNAADFSVNAIVVIITDGGNCDGTSTVQTVKQAIMDAVTGEKVESILTILVGINMASLHLRQLLEDYAKNAAFSQFIDAGNVTRESIAKLTSFISRNVSAQSRSLGTGGPSKSLTI